MGRGGIAYFCSRKEVSTKLPVQTGKGNGGGELESGKLDRQNRYGE